MECREDVPGVGRPVKEGEDWWKSLLDVGLGILPWVCPLISAI